MERLALLGVKLFLCPSEKNEKSPYPKNAYDTNNEFYKKHRLVLQFPVVLPSCSSISPMVPFERLMGTFPSSH